MSNDEKEKRHWFGPKRTGLGVSPQTWQGWVIVLAVVAAIVVVTMLLR
ncbi:MAG: hypothetical protein WBW04_06900 [Nitrolancea sp.]